MLDPLTHKRIAQFKQLKRSYYALIILGILYALSLGAELIANDNPLFVSYNQRWYFPVVKTYKRSDLAKRHPPNPTTKLSRKSCREPLS